MLILFESFLGILPPAPLFLPSFCATCLSIRHIEIPEHCIGNPSLSPEILWKRWFAWAFRRDFFSCIAIIFTWIWTHSMSLMTSLIFNLPLAVFYRQSLSCEVIDKSKGDLNSSNRNYFPLTVPWAAVISRSILIEWLFFEVSTTIFCMLIWPRQSLHTVFFRIFVAPVIWSILEIAFLPHPAPSPVWFNRAFIFQSLLLEFWCANTATSIAQDHLFSNV